MKKKNILFITHHNNDFDHFLPLIIRFKKDKKLNFKILAFYNKEGLLRNKLHKYICESNDIELDSISDCYYFKWINKAIIKIYSYVINNVNETKQTSGVFDKNTFLKFIQSVLIKYVVLSSTLLLDMKKMRQYIDSNNFDLVIIDNRSIEEPLIDISHIDRLKKVITGKIDPINHLLFRFVKRIREQEIPIVMIPHGPHPISKKIVRRQLENPFQPDFLFLCSENEISSDQNENMQAIKGKFLLGDPRFSIDWINYLESCALEVYSSSVKKPKDKTILLYLMDHFTYTSKGNQEFKLQMHQDILLLVNYFPDLEIWVKHHPRYVFEIPVEDFIHKDRQKNIRQFGNETDTNILLAHADICISLSSTVLIAPLLQRKPIIFYDRWKEKHNYASIYDDITFRTSSKEELIAQYKKIINGEYSIHDSFLETFNKNVFSTESLDESMVEKYTEKIKQILEVE